MEKEYYIYIFLDQRCAGIWEFEELVFNYKPFYIGKGKKRRLNAHFCKSQLAKNTPKNNLINKIKRELNELPIHNRIYEGLTEEEAFEIEKRIIIHFGRFNDGGLLMNLTTGGDGHSGYHEPKITHRKKIYQYDLNGIFIKEWPYISELANHFKNSGNISTAVKRNGTCYGYIWSYKYKKKLPPKIKFQMPIKYINIQQIDIKTGKVLKTFKDALAIENKLKLRSGARNKIYDCLKNKTKTAYGYKWKI